MVVITRSKTTTSKKNNNYILENTADISSDELLTSSDEDFCSISSSDFQSSKENDDSIDDEENDEEDNDDEEDIEDYLRITKEITEDPKLNKTLEKIKNHIQTKRNPKLIDILKAKISFKNKVDLFELMILYENTDLYTEENLQYREAITKLLPIYKKEFKENSKIKSELNAMEKKIKSSNDSSSWPSKIMSLKTSESNREIIYRKFVEFRNMNPEDDEHGKLERWLRTALSLPFDHLIDCNLPKEDSDLSKYFINVKQKLDEQLYGLAHVKEQILLFLHMKLKNPSLQGCCLGLIGPPGCGKTTLARCISSVLNYPFQQISFGGMNNADYLKGHGFTYVGAKSGEIINCLIRMKCKNGILFFDEYDKISQNPDIVSSLLHITDFSQNNNFRDNYLCDLEIDLSTIWFIYSMNELPENSAMKDRIFPIYISGYSNKEKIRIIIDYLFPKHLKTINLNSNDIQISESVANYIIENIVKHDDKGIRTIEKAVRDIIQKLSFIVAHQSCPEFPTLSFFPKNEKLEFPIILTNSLIDCCLLNNNYSSKHDNIHMYV